MDIDPVEYGKLIEAVKQLENRVSSMDTDVKELLKLANQSRGGFWVGMSIASFFGGLVTFFMKSIFGH